MELRQLRYFVVLAEELHFGRAARRLSISQPPLSLSIRRLETQLGARLLERSSRQVSLSPAGSALLIEARQILAQVAEAQTLVARVAAGTQGRLRIGFVASMLYRALPQRLEAFGREHPRIELTMREMNSAEQIDALRTAHLEPGFAHAQTVPAGLAGTEYLSEPFVCCLPAAHPQARRRPAELPALAAEPFVLFAREASPAYYDRIVALCVDAGFTPEVRHEVRHWLTVVAMVAAGMGVALVPASLARAGMAGVRYLPLRNRKIGSITRMLWAPDRVTPTLQALIERVSPPGV